MKNLKASLAIGACLLISSAGTALAGQAGGQPGSPKVSCGSGSATNTPGSSASNSGSPFGGGTAGNVYANATTGVLPGKSGNANGQAPANATSQYDVACLNVTTNQPPKQLH